MEFTVDEIKNMIRKFSLNESREELNNYYSYKSLWEILKLGRSEPSHTHFLAWFFNCPEFNNDINNGPCKKLLVLLLERAEKQGLLKNYEKLVDSFYNSRLCITSCKADSEFPIEVKEGEVGKPPYGKGNIDVFLTIDILLNNRAVEPEQQEKRTIHIVIENKIDAPETTKWFNEQHKQVKTSKDSVYTLYQTDAYNQYIKKTYSKDINLFVFLNPVSDYELDNIVQPECHNKEYIQINYQQLLDKIIEPIYKRSNIPSNHKSKLFDYIRILSKPSETDTNKNITIMAIPAKEKELLVNFFNENQDLIRAAITAIGDEDLSDALANIEKDPKDRTKYKISFNGNTVNNISKAHLASKFVETYISANPNITKDELSKTFSGICSSFFTESNDKKHDEVIIGNDKLYIPNQIWGAGSKYFNDLMATIDSLKNKCKIKVEKEQ
ncbi:MAG: PD-(D/E)XK nuclease family protein [Bacteroidaceae bacterium]|nr:PD-(D/E)XK nuclease family protein [Bacteroidaceae bacterium]